MNDQMMAFASLIEVVEHCQDPEMEKRLRTICRNAADAAPKADLVRMAQFLYNLRMEAARHHAESN